METGRCRERRSEKERESLGWPEEDARDRGTEREQSDQYAFNTRCLAFPVSMGTERPRMRWSSGAAVCTKANLQATSKSESVSRQPVCAREIVNAIVGEQQHSIIA